MLQNASAAMHIAELLQADTDGAKKALEAFTGLAGRGETFHTTTGLTIIDDAYNASPVSMKAGLEVLAQLKGSRHIAVLADMLELGERSPEFHREVGRFLAALPIDQIYLYGPLAEEIGNGLCECLPENQSRSIFRFRDFDALRKTLMTNVHEGDVLLFKGSNSMRLSEIVKDFRKDQR
jgi:UDP-N-acetylmuramoyl-tripeptide--D-alanyl-D-alanine ligase